MPYASRYNQFSHSQFANKFMAFAPRSSALGRSRRWCCTVSMSCDIYTHTPAKKSSTNFLLCQFIIRKCSTNRLGHGHGYELHSLSALMGSLRLFCLFTEGLVGYQSVKIYQHLSSLHTFYRNLTKLITSAATQLVLTPYVRSRIRSAALPGPTSRLHRVSCREW